MAEQQPFFCADCDAELKSGEGVRKKDGRVICQKCEQKLRDKAERGRQADLFVEQSSLFNPARRRNVPGFKDRAGQFHPIRAGKGYNEFLAGDFEPRKRPTQKEQREIEKWQRQETKRIREEIDAPKRSLAQFVRAYGGIVPGGMYAGEIRRLGYHETGTTGLINQKARIGSHKQTAQYVMDAANQEGYRDRYGERFTSIGDFLAAVEESAVKGISKSGRKADTAKQKRAKQMARAMSNPHKSYSRLSARRSKKAAEVVKMGREFERAGLAMGDPNLRLRGMTLQRRGMRSGEGHILKGGTVVEGPVGRLPNPDRFVVEWWKWPNKKPAGQKYFADYSTAMQFADRKQDSADPVIVFEWKNDQWVRVAGQQPPGWTGIDPQHRRNPQSRRYGQRAQMTKQTFDILVKEYGREAAHKALAFWNSQPASFRAGVKALPFLRDNEYLWRSLSNPDPWLGTPEPRKSRAKKCAENPEAIHIDAGHVGANQRLNPSEQHIDAGHVTIVNPKKRDKFSRKVSQLVGEGYPQKQAVAIAFSEQRAGKLNPEFKILKTYFKGDPKFGRTTTLTRDGKVVLVLMGIVPKRAIMRQYEELKAAGKLRDPFGGKRLNPAKAPRGSSEKHFYVSADVAGTHDAYPKYESVQVNAPNKTQALKIGRETLRGLYKNAKRFEVAGPFHTRLSASYAIKAEQASVRRHARKHNSVFSRAGKLNPFGGKRLNAELLRTKDWRESRRREFNQLKALPFLSETQVKRYNWLKEQVKLDNKFAAAEQGGPRKRNSVFSNYRMIRAHDRALIKKAEHNARVEAINAEIKEVKYDPWFNRRENKTLQRITIEKLKDRKEKLTGKRNPALVADDAETARALIQAPYVGAQYSRLGGAGRESVLIVVSLDPKDTWANGILENSRYTRFHLGSDGVLEQFTRSRGLTTFRKTRVKDIREAVSKINKYLSQQAKKNPSVTNLSKTFQGKADGATQELKAANSAPANLARAGKLVFLKVAGKSIRIPGAVVAIAPNEKLWIVGDHAPLFASKAQPGTQADYGEVSEICYETAKAHIGNGKRFEYVHEFGENGGRRPHLLIDSEGMPILRGGDYKIRAEGIVN